MQSTNEQLAEMLGKTTYPAGTTLFLNVTAITITSGVGIGYHTDTAKG
jgi:hypothetical protein